MWEHRDNNGYQTQWKADFRMSGGSFQKFLQLVSPALIKRDTQFHGTIAVEKRIEGHIREICLQLSQDLLLWVNQQP